MKSENERPKILIATPEFTHWPEYGGFGKVGGLADMTSSLAIALRNQGVNVAVALPYLRKAADNKELTSFFESEISNLESADIDPRHNNLFLIDHPHFRDLNRIYEGNGRLLSLEFQRPVLNEVIPHYSPDLVHTHDWMTGLISPLSHPDIKTLHTIHNFHTETLPIDIINHFGIPLYNAKRLWYTNGDNRTVDFQMSGIFGSNAINTPSRGFLEDLCSSKVPDNVHSAFTKEVRNKMEALTAFYVINSPGDSYNPETDPDIHWNYSGSEITDGKHINKEDFQRKFGLEVNPFSPLLLWPNRAETHQKGIQFLHQNLPSLMHDHQNPPLQLAIIADGPYMSLIRRDAHEFEKQGFKGRIFVSPFSDAKERKAYAAADAVLNCSSYAPCELVQMKGAKYGTLPVVRRIGGLRDTAPRFEDGGYSFTFDHYDAHGLHQGINSFLSVFHGNPELFAELRNRAHKTSHSLFTDKHMAENYIKIYERILERKVT